MCMNYEFFTTFVLKHCDGCKNEKICKELESFCSNSIYFFMNIKKEKFDSNKVQNYSEKLKKLKED